MREISNITSRVRDSAIALRVARSVVAGVEVRVKGYKPVDMGWLYESLKSKLKRYLNAGKVEIQYGRSTTHRHLRGSLVLNVMDHDAWDDILKVAMSWANEMKRVGIVMKLGLGDDVMEWNVVQNKDADKRGMYSEAMSYDTWKKVLEWLGLYNVKVLHGSMPIQQYLRAYRSPGDPDEDNKVQIFAKQVRDMAEMALKRGFRELTWS